MKWRLGLVAILAAVVVGGFVPHGAPSGSEGAASEMVQIAESPLSMPLSCMDAAAARAARPPRHPSRPPRARRGAVRIRRCRRRRLSHSPPALLQMAVLPAGARDPLFHPPQFS